MRYRALDFLVCINCAGTLLVKANEIIATEFSERKPCGFQCVHFCSRFNILNPHISLRECRECHRMQVESGGLMCDTCGVTYKISQGIPDFTKQPLSLKRTDKDYLSGATTETYSLLWKKADRRSEALSYHYSKMQEVLPEKIAQGKLGLEVGCGAGFDTRIMAQENPFMEIVALDISEGVYTAGYLNRKHGNVHVVRASSLNLPLRDNIFDFCYSFGVVHHTPDPQRCLSGINRTLRQNGKTFVYVYEDHEDNIWKKYPVRVVTMARKITSKMDKRSIYLLSVIASPVIFVIFTVPAWLMGLFPETREFAARIPFNFGKGPFSLRGDLFDRFAAPIELRFNRERLGVMLEKTGFKNVRFTMLKASAGIVAWACKRQ